MSWLADRQTIFGRSDYCAWCGDWAEHVDHVWPRVRGGSDELLNLVPACRRCNLEKAAKIIGEEWMPRDRTSGWLYDLVPEPDDYLPGEMAS